MNNTVKLKEKDKDEEKKHAYMDKIVTYKLYPSRFIDEVNAKVIKDGCACIRISITTTSLFSFWHGQ